MSLRVVATALFGFIVTAIASALISANVRKLADKHGWDNFLVRWTERFRWERLRGVWWLWSIFGLSGSVVLALWLTPLIVGPTQSKDEIARQVTLQSELNITKQELEKTKQALQAERQVKTGHHQQRLCRAKIISSKSCKNQMV